MTCAGLFRRTLPRRSAAIALAIAISLSGADLPVREVVLYKHGVGFFQRQGTIPSGDEARLDFRDAEMNDVLKSLTVSDATGAKVSGIRYDSNESLEEKLGRYPFAIADQEPLSAFLDRMKGSQVQLRTDKALNGTIIAARSHTSGPDGDRRTEHEQLTLLLDSGDLMNLDLSAISTVRFSDAKLQDQLKQYLLTVAQSRSKDKRSIYIDSTSIGTRRLDVAYISPAAIWKSSYRLTLADPSSTLEGWAIVDNTTDDDWNSVKLSVVSGRPVSFISQLDTPRYGNRQVAELPEDAAAGPVVYNGAVSDQDAKQLVANQAEKVSRGFGPGSAGGVVGGVIGGVPSAAPPEPTAGRDLSEFTRVESMAKLQSAPTARFKSSQSTAAAGATGATLGELFEYNFANPVTIKKNQSAMLPFLAEKLEARKLLIYQEERGEHPVNAAELTNKTGKTLDGGPITVYDSGAYAGEALFETLRDGDRRLIGYAVDYGTRISSNFESGTSIVRELHATYGFLETKTAAVQTRTLKIRNVDAKAKTLIVEQPINRDFRPLSPKPSELTAKAARYEVKLPANGEASLEVKLEYLMTQNLAVADSTPDALTIFLQNKAISEKGRTQLQEVVETKQQISQTDAELSDISTRVRELDGDQNRWRQNIMSLRGIPGQEEQVRKYSVQLADSDAQLGQLRDQQKQLEQRKTTFEKKLRDQIAKLDF